MATVDTFRPLDWKTLYHLAVIELDPAQMLERIADARNAILNRVEETLTKPHEYNERQALTDALNGLRVLRQEHERRIQQCGQPRQKIG